MKPVVRRRSKPRGVGVVVVVLGELPLFPTSSALWLDLLLGFFSSSLCVEVECIKLAKAAEVSASISAGVRTSPIEQFM